jgi:hypothetical protein
MVACVQSVGLFSIHRCCENLRWAKTLAARCEVLAVPAEMFSPLAPDGFPDTQVGRRFQMNTPLTAALHSAMLSHLDSLLPHFSHRAALVLCDGDAEVSLPHPGVSLCGCPLGYGCFRFASSSSIAKDT